MNWWERFYVLMDENNEPGEGGSGGGGKPPADPPKPKGNEGGDPGGEPGERAIPVDVLPEELRDKPEAEQRFILSHMVKALGQRNAQVDDLKEQIAELRGAVSNRPEPPKEPDPNEGKPLEELILEDADAALESWMKRKGLDRAFDNLEGRIGETEFTIIASQIDDFEEYEDDVRALLKKSGAPATRQNILGAYKMALGDRALMERQRTGRKNSGSVPPSPPEPPKGGEEEEPQISSLEQEIARAHGMTPEEWVESRDKDMELKLPT